MSQHPPLTDFQVEVVRLFFTLPEADGYLLAGGAALAATGISTRPTQDLDLFTTRADVSSARAALVRAVAARGWSVGTVRETASFCRLVIHGPEDLLVDLAQDSAPRHPPTATFAGPTFSPEELAGRKLLALFDRAAARDFADVFVLSSSFDRSRLLEFAADVDPGLDLHVLAQRFGTLDRFTDDEIPVASLDAAPLRRFFARWAAQLRV